MLAKIAIVLLILFLSINFNTLNNTAGAQISQRQNYLNQLSQFNKASEEYITARSGYLSFQTASSKNQTFIKTKQYLEEANKLYQEYANLVKAIGEKVDWQNTSFNKDNQFKIIDAELEFLKRNLEKTTSTNTLEELPPISLELKDRIDSSTNTRISTALTVFNIASVESTHVNFKTLSNDLINFTKSQIGETNPSLVANWQSEIESINDNVEKQLATTKQELEKLSENQTPSEEIIKTINQAKVNLARSKNLFAEIIKVL